MGGSGWRDFFFHLVDFGARALGQGARVLEVYCRRRRARGERGLCEIIFFLQLFEGEAELRSHTGLGWCGKTLFLDKLESFGAKGP